MNKIELINAEDLIYQAQDSLKELHVLPTTAEQMQLTAVFSLFGHENHCELIVDSQGNAMTKACDCTWFAQDQDCPHCRLSLLWLYEHQTEALPIHYENEGLKQCYESIEQYSQRLLLRELQHSSYLGSSLIQESMKIHEEELERNIKDDHYSIEPVLKEEWTLSFKVGKEKKYVIKSITDFLNAINNHKTIAYGKNLSFVHREDAFEEASLSTLMFMRKYIQKAEAEAYHSAVKEFTLDGIVLDDFFELYDQGDGDEYAFELQTIDYQFDIDCRVENHYYIFHFESEFSLHLGKKHAYYQEVIGKTIILYRILLDEEGISALFLKNLMSSDLVIAEDEYAQFYRYIGTNVSRYMDLHIPSTNQDEVMERAELYGDIDEHGMIYFYLYCYGASNVRFSGFDQNRIISYEQELIEAYIKKYASSFDAEHHMVYMDENDDQTIDFISEGLPYLSQYCEIYVSEELKTLGTSKSYHISVGVKFKNELLALDIQSLEIPKDELAHVLQAYKRKKKFYRLKNGELLSLQSDDLSELNGLLEDYHISTANLNNGKVTLDAFRMFSLDQYAKDCKLIEINREKSFVTCLENYYEPKQYAIPSHYQTILRDYQKDGFAWLSTMRQYHFNGILADDMGLGKTLQVIALLEANKSEKCSLVVCPASLIYNWEDEVHKFTKGLSVYCITGSQEDRIAGILKCHEYDLLVTSYDYIRRDIEHYQDIVFDTVILDEAQYIKNQNTKNAISVKQLQASHKLALTGTPIENSLAELWSIFDFLMPDYLYNYHYFQKQYENDIVKNKDEEKQLMLKQLVSPFILRRNKKDVLTELPDKIEKVRMIEFSEEEHKLYLANLVQVKEELGKMKDLNGKNRVQVLSMLTRLRQLCCDPRLLYENIFQLSTKLTDCLMLIEELHENHQKVLLFSGFTSILDLLAKELKRKQISYYMLTGKTNKEERNKLVKQFQEDNTSVFLISLKAGGTGLNLTAAEAVIHFDPWWNQSAQNQATDRAYRIGQNKNVQVFKLIMKDSIEEKIMKLQLQKKELADAFVEDNDGRITSMSKEELLDLFTL